MRLDLKVTPGARKTGFDGWFTDADGRKRLKVKVTAAPEKGKANKAVVKLLARALGVAPSDIEVVHGETDRNKTLQIAGAADELRRRIAAIGGTRE